MRMGDEHMINLGQRFNAQVTQTGASVNEHVFIHEHGGGAELSADPAATPQNFDPHNSPEQSLSTEMLFGGEPTAYASISETIAA